MGKLDVIAIRLCKDRTLYSDTPIKTPMDAVEVLGKELCELDREVVCIVNLQSDGRPINCNFVSMGALDQSMVHPREIFKSAILSNAAKMIMLHNHPSGSLNPSKEDTLITDRMLKLCDCMGIPLVDHIIVGGRNKQYFSFNQGMLMDFERNHYETDYHKLEFNQMSVAEMSQELHEEEEKEEQEAVEEAAIEETPMARRRRGR